MLDEKKTALRLEIDKTIQPKQYEPIKIQVSVEESFCWQNEEERDLKIKAYTEKITRDFITTFNHVVTKIGEKNMCIAIVTGGGDVPAKGREEVNVDTSEEWDFK